MIKDLRLHGSIGIADFFAFAAGPSSYNTYFYEEEPARIRFFSRGNEFTISEDSVSYKGTGGSFCEYMFGVEKPLADMEKSDILNRLIMFGAFLDKEEKVVFTNNTEGSEKFSRLFLQGHPVANYYFIVSSEFDGDYRKRQKQILRAIGKFLKRTSLLSGAGDTELLESLREALKEDKSIVFVFKLVNRMNQEYYNAFRSFYAKKRELSHRDELYLEEIVLKNDIDRYQQERMKIDVMYKHPENRAVVDEYREVLVKGMSRDTLHASEYARLNRLRTLSIRNNIPVVLFDVLDDLLLKGKKVQETGEQEYLKDVRAILENLFFKDPLLKQHIIKEDIVRLIRAKHTAYSQNDRGFDQLLLDIGRACDELARESDDFSVFEEFSAIITYFDRFDNVHTLLSQLAFMKNVEFREESLRSLIGNKKAFDELESGLFRSIFVKDLIGNKYITNYGKKKIKLVLKGAENIMQGEASLKDVIAELKGITEEERLYHEIHTALKKRMRTFFPDLELKHIRERIRTDIAAELAARGISDRIPAKLFEKVYLDLRKESVYLNQILPLAIRTMDPAPREDFMENSGLDRFYIESLEKEFFEEKTLEPALLDLLREEGELSGTGGGERI
jgi:uncharacterized protein (TIGR04442 family)